jgi:hypothetical protein
MDVPTPQLAAHVAAAALQAVAVAAAVAGNTGKSAKAK